MAFITEMVVMLTVTVLFFAMLIKERIVTALVIVGGTWLGILYIQVKYIEYPNSKAIFEEYDAYYQAISLLNNSEIDVECYVVGENPDMIYLQFFLMNNKIHYYDVSEFDENSVIICSHENLGSISNEDFYIVECGDGIIAIKEEKYKNIFEMNGYSLYLDTMED